MPTGCSNSEACACWEKWIPGSMLRIARNDEIGTGPRRAQARFFGFDFCSMYERSTAFMRR